MGPVQAGTRPLEPDARSRRIGQSRGASGPTDLIDSLDEYKAYQDAQKAYLASAAQFIGAEKARDEAVVELNAAKKEQAVADDAKVAAAQKKLMEADERLTNMQLASYVKYFKENDIPEAKAVALAAMAMGDLGKVKPYAVLDTWPWVENRGPNPFLMATGQLGKPWEVGHFWEWFLTQQVPVLIEPIVKLLSPVVYFFHPGRRLQMPHVLPVRPDLGRGDVGGVRRRHHTHRRRSGGARR